MDARYPYLDNGGRPIAFAHRGGAHGGQENTRAAFADAVELGYRFLETDVHATADRVVVAFHDSRLDRVTDRTGTIEELPWSEVSLARVGGVEPIPRLAELLEAFPDARWNIDIKRWSAIKPLAAALRQADALDRVCLAGFSDLRLWRARRRIGSTVCTSKGPLGITWLRLTTWLRLPPLRASRVAVVQVPVRQGLVTIVNRSFVDGAHRRGVAVHVWTIDDEAEMGRLLDLGVDGIMTDRLDVLRTVLERRGQWSDG